MTRYAVFSLFSLFAAPLSAGPEELMCADLQQKYGVRSLACEDGGQPADARLRALNAQTLESHIFFVQGGSRLNRESKAQLEVLAKVLHTPPMSQACLQLVGHSDAAGGENANMRLAQRRADAVAGFLRAHLDNPNRIRAVLSEGEQRPLDGQPAMAAVNRRVEILARTCQ
jgi:outer membrane protein OmpA-like peptidoglycan-associated protein